MERKIFSRYFIIWKWGKRGGGNNWAFLWRNGKLGKEQATRNGLLSAWIIIEELFVFLDDATYRELLSISLEFIMLLSKYWHHIFERAHKWWKQTGSIHSVTVQFGAASENCDICTHNIAAKIPPAYGVQNNPGCILLFKASLHIFRALALISIQAAFIIRTHISQHDLWITFLALKL